MDNGYNQNYYQQPYNGYSYTAYPPKQGTNPLGIVSMVLGIVASIIPFLFCCCVPALGLINLPFSAAAIILGILQLVSKKNPKGKGFGIAGLILGVLSIIISVGMTIFMLVALSSSGNSSEFWEAFREGYNSSV